MSTPQVILTAGYDRAYHVLTLSELLKRDGVSIKGILVVTPYSWKRLRGMLVRRGLGFIWHSIPRLAGRRRNGQTSSEKDALSELMEELDVRPQSLRAWAQDHDVAYLSVKSINTSESVGFVENAQPDWVIYGGGGILHDSFIDAAKGRILNPHSGPLPDIRGMNACEWSLLLGYDPAVTIHLINRGIDTGGILSQHPVPVVPGDTIDLLRSRCVATGVKALRQTVLNPPKALPRPTENAAAQRQCFVLSPALRELLKKRLAQQQMSRGGSAK